MWMAHPNIAKAWSHGRSSVTGKKEFTPQNKDLPMHASDVLKRNRKKKK
jgi:hypothetical protein